jgi:hypothetical protein
MDVWYKEHGTLGSKPVTSFNSWFEKASLGTRIFRCGKGFIGTGPRNMEAGDIVCVLFGGQTPFVLRPSPGDKYELIGPCYVHGVMDGEVMQMDLEDEDFVFI